MNKCQKNKKIRFDIVKWRWKSKEPYCRGRAQGGRPVELLYIYGGIIRYSALGNK